MIAIAIPEENIYVLKDVNIYKPHRSLAQNYDPEKLSRTIYSLTGDGLPPDVRARTAEDLTRILSPHLMPAALRKEAGTRHNWEIASDYLGGWALFAFRTCANLHDGTELIRLARLKRFASWLLAHISELEMRDKAPILYDKLVGSGLLTLEIEAWLDPIDALSLLPKVLTNLPIPPLEREGLIRTGKMFVENGCSCGRFRGTDLMNLMKTWFGYSLRSTAESYSSEDRRAACCLAYIKLFLAIITRIVFQNGHRGVLDGSYRHLLEEVVWALDYLRSERRI